MVYLRRERLTGWGRTAPSAAEVAVLGPGEDPHAALAGAGERGIIARGLGRSYGDPAQNAGGRVVRVPAAHLDLADGELTADAGWSLDEILRAIVPQGWFVPVTPGTRYVTVGGAIAADIHGKNHHVDGTFGAHVRALDLLLADGSVRMLRRSDPADAPLLDATIGGMGLTGIILRATFGLRPIESSRILVDTRRTQDLDELMALMVEADAHATYSVAWIDSVAKGRRFGRGVLTTGEHAPASSLSGPAAADPLGYDPKVLVTAPPVFPGALLNKWSVAAFNEAWFRKAPASRDDEVQSIAAFFHPLDGVNGWNTVYGGGGFLQYQFAVPDEAGSLVAVALKQLQRIGAPAFLTVLKRFGDANSSPLSFPMKGWTLALDIPARLEGLASTLDRLDDLVLQAGGRLYLAKDSRADARVVAAGYPQWDAFRSARDTVDPNHLFRSDQSRRLGL